MISRCTRVEDMEIWELCIGECDWFTETSINTVVTVSALIYLFIQYTV